MKIEIGSVYRCTVNSMETFVVRVIHIDEQQHQVYAESLSDPSCYREHSSASFEGEPCGLWSVGQFEQIYVPMIYPGQIWKDLNK